MSSIIVGTGRSQSVVKEAFVTEETFVRGYKGQSQMDVNTINGLDISGRGAKMVGDIHRAVKEGKDTTTYEK